MLKKAFSPLFAMLAFVFAALSQPAMAAAIDVTALVTDIGAQAVPIGLVGTAVLLIMVAITAFLWVRRAAK